MKLLVKKGTTSFRAHIYIVDTSSAVAAPLTGLTYQSTGLKWNYFRDGDSSVTQLTPATATFGTWATSGFKEIDSANMPGWYEIGIPNAALASGSNSVKMDLFGVTNMSHVPIEIQLVDFDPNDATRLGLSALPNAACSTSASLITSGTSTDQLSVAAGKVLLQATQTGVTIPTVTSLTNAVTVGGYSAGEDPATLVLAATLDTGFTLKQTLRIIAAVTAGASSGGPGSPAFKSLDGGTTRVSGTADSGGNRSSITYNG